MARRLAFQFIKLVTILGATAAFGDGANVRGAADDFNPSRISFNLPTRRGLQKPLAAYVGDDLRQMSFYVNGTWMGSRFEFDRRYGAEVDAREIQSGFPLTESFILAHRYKTKIVYVFVHGITDSAYQGKDLARDLHQAGANLMAIRLSGHGKDSDNVNEIELADWQDDLDQAVERAKQLGEKIVIVGLSTGGALALDKAYRSPEDVAGVVAAAPAIGIADPVARFVGMIGGYRWLAPLIPRVGARNRDQTIVRQLQKSTHAVGVLYDLTQVLQKRIRRKQELQVPALFLTTSKDTAIQEKWIARLLPLSKGEWLKFVGDASMPVGTYDVRKVDRVLEILAADVPSHSGLVFDRLEVPYLNGNPMAFENGHESDPDNRLVHGHETNAHFSLITRAVHRTFMSVFNDEQTNFSCIEALMAGQ